MLYISSSSLPANFGLNALFDPKMSMQSSTSSFWIFALRRLMLSLNFCRRPNLSFTGEDCCSSAWLIFWSLRMRLSIWKFP